MGIEFHANDLMSVEVTANSNLQCRMYSEPCKAENWLACRVYISKLLQQVSLKSIEI